MAERRCIVSCEETDLCAYYSRMRTKNKHICLHLFTKFPYVSEAGVFIYWYKEQKKKMQKWLNKWMILYAVIKRHWVIIPIFLVSIVFLKKWMNESIFSLSLVIMHMNCSETCLQTYFPRYSPTDFEEVLQMCCVWLFDVLHHNRQKLHDHNHPQIAWM